MKQRTGSRCPVCYGLDIFGDRWTLLIVRDLLIGGKRRYREFLDSREGIATNILADRLRSLVAHGLATREDDPEHKGQAIYRPTDKALALQPVLDAIARWSLDHGPARLRAPPARPPAAAR